MSARAGTAPGAPADIVSGAKGGNDVVPRLWLVTDSEARHLIDREPFAKALKGLPEPDRLAVVRLAVEAYRRERLTRVGTKRPLSKCIDHAAHSYRQWRDERPDDYQLWRELIYTPRTTTTGSVDVSNNNPSRLEDDQHGHSYRDEC